MRTKTLLLTAALCAAGIATSKAQAVYSVNAVGYVNTDLVKGLNLISNPLNNTATGGNTIKSLFASAPLGSQIFKFNPATAKYDLAIVDEFSGDVTGDAASLVVAPGEGVFLSSPEAGKITFVGEVPTGSLSNPLPKGLSIRASQVPQAGTVSSLGYAPEEGDQIYLWLEATQKYDTHAYEFGSWSGGEPTVDVGEAFFLSTQVARNWTRTFNINQ
jgi:hypothetical protein